MKLTPQPLLDHLRQQYKVFTGPDGDRIRQAVGATDEDIAEIAADIASLEKEIARERAKLN